MNKVKITVGALVSLLFGMQAAQANEGRALKLGALRKGVYYSLTPAAAQAMKIDLAKLVELSQLQQSEELAFQVKEDGELDLSIYNNGAFKQLRADIVKMVLN